MESIADRYKKTEVGFIPMDWKVETVLDAFDICNNLRLPISEEVRAGMQGEYPYYGPTRVQDYLNEYRVDGEYALIGEDGDHFLKWSEIPMTQLASGRFNVNNHAHLIKGKNDITLTRWFYFFFKNRDLTQYLTRQGAGRYKLSKGTLAQIPCAVPPTIQEQAAISAVLSDVDALIGRLEDLIAKKRNIKQGAMQHLLTPKKEWTIKQFGEVLKIRHGKSQRGIEIVDGKYPILGTGGVLGRTNSFLWDRPSVLIGRKGTIDKPQFMDSPFWTVDTLFYTEIFDGYNAKYIFYMFNQIDWYSCNEASGVPSLNANTIEKIERKFPSYDEQVRISSIISDMDAEISSLETKLKKYKNIKLGMMQDLLTGKIRLV